MKKTNPEASPEQIEELLGGCASCLWKRFKPLILRGENGKPYAQIKCIAVNSANRYIDPLPIGHDSKTCTHKLKELERRKNVAEDAARRSKELAELAEKQVIPAAVLRTQPEVGMTQLMSAMTSQFPFRNQVRHR